MAVALARDYEHMVNECQVQDMDKLQDQHVAKVDACLYKTEVHKT